MFGRDACRIARLVGSKSCSEVRDALEAGRLDARGESCLVHRPEAQSRETEAVENETW